MTTGHTPGPWRWTEGGGTEIVTDAQVDLAGNPIVVAQAIAHAVLGHQSLEEDEIDANARLVAAAPELLAALDALHRQVANSMKFTREADGWHAVDEELARVMEQASAAIDKAEGQTEP